MHIFDLRTFDQVATLRAHRNEVRAIHKNGNYIISAGKGSINSGHYSNGIWEEILGTL